MWPFKKKKSAADFAIEALPKAISFSAEEWRKFYEKPDFRQVDFEGRLIQFADLLGANLRRWSAFEKAPDEIFLLIAAKGVERSRTHLRIEIEAALRFPLPAPHERSDAEENQIIFDRVVERASRKWTHFSHIIKFAEDTPIEDKVAAFKSPFLEGVRADFPMLSEATDEFLDELVRLGIVESGTVSVSDAERILRSIR